VRRKGRGTLRAFALGLGAWLLASCMRSAPPSVYTNWEGSRIALRTAYERFALPNGLEVVMNPDARLPIVAVRLVYRVGSKDDPPRLEGFAHLFEHLMFQGSRNVGEDMYFKHLERVGAPYIQGETRVENSVYSETVPSSQLELALWLESDRMAFLLDHVNAETFETQRQVVENELREKLDNSPYGRVGTFIEERLFPPGHPYHGRALTTEGLKGASLDDVRAFWRAHYRPNNATLYLSGDFEAPEARRQIAKYFAPIAAGCLEPSLPVRDVPSPRPGSRLDVEAAVPLGMVVMTWLTPPFGAQEDAELDVIGDMFEQGQLAWNLLEAEEVATRIVAGQQSQKLVSVFQIAVTLRPGVAAERVVAIVDKVLARLRREWQEPSFIRSMSFRTLVELALAHEEPSRRASQMAEDDAMTGDPNYIEKNVARYEAITAESLMQTARKFLDPTRRLVTVVTPVPSAPIAGRLVKSK
jgi:zinc protease